MVHADGPLSLYVSSSDGDHHGITFQPEPNGCLDGGCAAIAVTTPAGGLTWQAASPHARLLDHDHEPEDPFDAPRPGTWVVKP